MSVAAKTPLIRVELTEGKTRHTCFLTKEGLQKVRKLLDSIPDDEIWYPIEQAFPEIADPLKGPGISLRGVRHRLGLTQKEMAKKIGVSQGDLSKMEKGLLQIGKKLAMRFGKALKCDYRRFL
jgi:DNA-binding XRE family transcriptional regulator